MTDKEIIAVVQAHIEGKQIQFWGENSQKWLDCANNEPEWDFCSFDFRVKPKPKARPYKDRDECWADMQKHKPFGWVKHKFYGNYVSLVVIANDDSFECYNNTYTYVDGSPFGVVEEE